MRTVDEKVVEMQFQNQQFETGIQKSLKSLENLKKSLDLDDSAKSLSKLEQTANSFSLEGMNAGIAALTNKFSTMGIVAMTAIQNITNSAIAYGKRMVSAFTIDPMKTGFQEYETQINAIQTVLANTSSKGTTLTQVNDALDELNKYADKTIYNFTEMTRNIGTFTAAGVELDTSVSAIKGIANIAAVSGSTAQQASTAMYQLSQALASGTVKLQDWNSVVNAGMGGQVFQDALKETARVHGVAIDSMIKNEGSFRETLKAGWLTSEILTETLSKFTGDLNAEQLKTMGYTEEQIKSIMEMGEMANNAATKVKTFTQLFDTLKEAAQSGWTQSWEIIVGDFEEAKELLTNMSDTFGEIINASSEARISMLQGWKDLGGRTALIKAATNAFEGVLSIITPVKEAFKDIFPPITSKQLFNMTEGLRNLTEKLKMGEETASNLKRTFKGVFAVFDIGLQAVKALGRGFSKVVEYFAPATSGILDFTGGIGDFIVSINEAIKSSDAFNKAIETIGTFLKPVADGLKNFVSIIKDGFEAILNVDTSGIESFMDRVQARFAPLTKLGEMVGNIISKISSALAKLTPVFFAIATKVGEGFRALQENITEGIQNFEFDGVFDIVNGGLLAGILIALKKFVGALTNIADNGGSLLKGVLDIFDGVRGCLEAYQSRLKAGTLMMIAGAIAILSGSLLMLSLIDSAKLTSSLVAMTVLLTELFASLAIYEKTLGAGKMAKIGRVVTLMLGLSTSILILATAMKQLSSLDWGGVTRGLVAITGLTAVITASAKVLSTSRGKLVKGATGLIIFAGAIALLANTVEKLGALDMETIGKGLLGVGVLCLELAAFMKLADLDKMGIGKGVGLVLLAASLNVLADAVAKFSQLSWEGIGKGLTVMAGVLTEIAIFTKLTANAKGLVSTATGMVILGSAMLIFASAIEKMGGMAMDEIGRGLLTMAGALGAITIALNFMPKNMIGMGLGLVGIATALVILSSALGTMGGMTWDEIARGLTVLAGSLTIIATAMHFMTTALPGAAALLVISGALAVLTPVLNILGGMPLTEIGKSLLAIAGVFAVLGVSSALLAPVLPIMLGLGGAITLFGVGCLAAGAGILAFSAGLSALAVSGTAGAAALVVIVTSIIGLIPMLVEQIGLAIVAFASAIATGAPAIAEAIGAVILAIMSVLTTSIPTVVSTVMLLLTTLLNSVVTFIPMLVDAGMKLILGIISGISNNIGAIVESAIMIVVNFLNGIATMIPLVIQAGFDLVLGFINGLADSMRNNTGLMIAAVSNLMSAIIETGISVLKASITGFLGVGKSIMNSGFIQGIKDKIGNAKEAVGDLAQKCINNIKDFGSGFFEAGTNIIGGFVDGIRSKISEAADWAANLARSALDSAKHALGIHSPSKEFFELGEYSDKGFINGLKSMMKAVGNAGASVGTSAMDGMKNTIQKAVDVLSIDDKDIPKIRPVLDLSDVEAKSKRLGELVAQPKSIDISTTLHKAEAAVQKIDRVDEYKDDKDGADRKSGNVYKFEQNNYSPKPLPRSEIYRDTKNLFASMKDVVETK